ncbi:MAG: pyridoxal-phosphate dependent enzyme [Litoreibacter sp.]
MSIISQSDITNASSLLSNVTLKTPTLPLHSDRWRKHLPNIAGGAIKLELFQQVGSFKARGAYLGIQSLDETHRKSGVTAASGGNHALAVAWAAQKLGVKTKIAIPKTADPIRINGCRDMGAEVILCDDIAHAFDTMERIVSQNGMSKIHPFEGRYMTLGAATCGAEFIAQHPQLEVVIVPVGGGGLISGISAAVKFANPDIMVIGVEPFGADTMYRSFETGTPASIDQVNTIADSLGSPTALPYSFGIAKEHVDEIVRVEDNELCDAMRIYHAVLGLAVEPACAAALAGAMGPLRSAIEGKHVGLIACGSNIGLARYHSLVGSA